MGDRCYVEVYCSEEDALLFDNVIGPVQGEFSFQGVRDSVVTVAGDEVNYAGYNELCDLAGRGIVFFGYHGSGDEYSGAVFASDGESGYQDVVDDHDGLMVPVRIDWVRRRVKVSAANLRHVKRYMQARINAERRLGAMSTRYRRIDAGIYAGGKRSS